ncbi:MAG: hypothetical protein ACI9WS_001023 [Paraglaciecola psychrophila]|jgi:uncharacterized protein (TIGR02647 family)
MTFNTELIGELNILARYNLNTTQEGIKVHSHDASDDVIAAVSRLHSKGLVTQSDGGYLTSLGREAAQHSQSVLSMLQG